VASSTPERLYRGSVRVISGLFIVLGIAILGVTLGAGGGPLSLGVLMGIAFLGVGVGRLWLTSRMDR
jgi:hypothetical protein